MHAPTLEHGSNNKIKLFRLKINADDRRIALLHGFF